MRTLLYVPIIHDEADLGRAGPALVRESAARSGEARWALHKECVSRFWASVAAHLRTLGPHRLKIYQDGLVTTGEVTRRVVEEAARRGSQNYQLLLELLNGGAEIRQTEDPRLLLEEHELILGALDTGAAPPEQPHPERDRLRTDRLMAERDKFIARTIGATLRDGELGVLFIGANHNVLMFLVSDISVEMVKDPKRVRAYFEALFLGRDDKDLDELRRYVTSPVTATQE